MNWLGYLFCSSLALGGISLIVYVCLIIWELEPPKEDA